MAFGAIGLLEVAAEAPALIAPGQVTGVVIGREQYVFALASASFRLPVSGFFLYEGIAICRGRIPIPVGIAIGSLLLGLIFFGLVTSESASIGDFRTLGSIAVATRFRSRPLSWRLFSVDRQHERWWNARRRQSAR